MKRRLGFVSVSGIALAVVLLAGIAAWTLLLGQALFSPGPLSALAKGKTYGGVSSHAQLAHDCGACHSAPWSTQTMAERCLSCHTEVASQISSKSGLHSRLVATLSSPTCRGCHTDHRGQSGSLTVTDATTFPHDLTGYSLAGHWRTSRGTRFACADCHGADLAHFDQAVCASCHASIDPSFMRRHESAFGKTCLLCHNGRDRQGSGFDHNKLPFRLVGKHAQVPCEGCHSTVGGTVPQNTPQDCHSCHAKMDKHGGKFGQQCGQCHTPNGWGNATFDHTIFPVDHGSRGQQSDCTTCHPNGVTTYTCLGGCHVHTPANVQGEHGGRALSDLADCIRCHAGGQGEGGGGG